MNLTRDTLCPAGGSRGEKASAILVVIVFLSAVAIMLVGNALTLRSLKREIRLIDQRQKSRIEAYSKNATNVSAGPSN